MDTADYEGATLKTQVTNDCPWLITEVLHSGLGVKTIYCTKANYKSGHINR